MTNYVLGFLFNNSFDKVCLIEKQRGPSANIGKWNGIGGKIERDEMPAEAMIREFEEETGVYHNIWNYVTTVYDTDYIIHTYYDYSDDVMNCHTNETEKVCVFDVDKLPDNLAYTTTKILEQINNQHL